MMFLHIDMDYFFAQIEEQRHSYSKDEIVAVCVLSGRNGDSGVISTVNYPGRNIGLKSGMPISIARKKAPQKSYFLPIDRPYYESISEKIDSIIRKYSKKVSKASIDEWNLEVDQIAEETGLAIKSEIHESTGLKCTVGIAPSVLGAKIAAKEAKPDGFLMLDEYEEEKLISSSEVSKVPGIGKKTAEELASIGIIRVSDIKSVCPISLAEKFGIKTGAFLHELGSGEYGTELDEEKEQTEISRISSLKNDTRDELSILIEMSKIAPDIKKWIKNHKKSYSTLSIIIITTDMKMHTKSISFRAPKDHNAEISKDCSSLLKNFLDENPKEIRRIGIRFANFTDMDGQTTLF
jgi:nucleotidyltransferase/DNA polymerase involved in DNA repair